MAKATRQAYGEKLSELEERIRRGREGEIAGNVYILRK